MDYLTTKEGIHATLDVIGLVFDGADVVNTIFYLVEGDYANAALSGISCVPLFGSAVGKGALLKIPSNQELFDEDELLELIKELNQEIEG